MSDDDNRYEISVLPSGTRHTVTKSWAESHPDMEEHQQEFAYMKFLYPRDLEFTVSFKNDEKHVVTLENLDVLRERLLKELGVSLAAYSVGTIDNQLTQKQIR